MISLRICNLSIWIPKVFFIHILLGMEAIYAPMLHERFFANKCIRNSISGVINTTTPEILDKVGTHSLQSFSQHVKTDILQSYGYECNRNNCYVCAT